MKIRHKYDMIFLTLGWSVLQPLIDFWDSKSQKGGSTMRTKFQTAMAWLKAIGVAMTIAADAGQRIASAVDAASKAST